MAPTAKKKNRSSKTAENISKKKNVFAKNSIVRQHEPVNTSSVNIERNIDRGDKTSSDQETGKTKPYLANHPPPTHLFAIDLK